jgi:hypothetical protein
VSILSEATAAMVACEQIIEMRISLLYVGIPVNAKSNPFENNKTVANKNTILHLSLNMRKMLLAYQ